MPRPTPFIINPPDDFLSLNPVLSDLAERLGLAYGRQGRVVDDTHLRAVGTALWEALQLDEALDKAKEKAGQQALPIIIDSEDAAVQALPWETLYHPDRKIFLGRSAGFTLTRRSPGPHPDLPEPEQGPLRVLLFTSLPDDLEENERLDVEAEQAAVQEALLESEQNGEIVLEMPDDGRFETLQSCLQEFKPHLVYLSGHGQFTLERHNARAWGSLLFENRRGRKKTVPEDRISECFQNTGVQLLVISACLSAKHHPDYPENGLTRRLYRNGIPYVVGMRESVMDKAGIRFAHTLLKNIADRRPADVALQSARKAIVEPVDEDTFRDAGDPARAAMSLGQWCLPQMMSHDNNQTIISWEFTPRPRGYSDLKTMLGKVAVPDRFIGRRRELRRWQNELRYGKPDRMLITGAGGMGKTALAGKLIDTLRKDGYHAYTFSLLPEHNWQDVLTDMELALADDALLYRKFELIQSKGLSPSKKAEYTLNFLLKRHNEKLVLFFDNLESVQEAQAPHSLTDEPLAVWVDAARKNAAHGLKLIMTSRWRLPDWPEMEHYPVGRPIYGDYLAFSRLRRLSADKKQLRRLYQVLGGNFRALEFFVTAARSMNIQDEEVFLNSLKDAEAEIQTNMALAEVISQRSEKERELLNRLTAYRTPIPMDGVKVLYKSSFLSPEKQRLDAEVDTLLQKLLDVSLVEQYRNDVSEQMEYCLSPIVRSWLQANRAEGPGRELLIAAAEFLLWLWEEDLNISWQHLMETHLALKAAGLDKKRKRLVLDYIIEPLNRNGMYQHLLDEWLLPLTRTDDPQILGDSYGQIGKQYFHLGDYDTALEHLKKSLAITQEIGDKSGEGTTLNNISQIYDARGDYDTALEYLKKSLAITQEVGDKSGEGTTLNNISQIFKARGDYDTALEYLKKSLAIQQEIGDKSGEGTTLNNISQIFKARGDYDTALEYLKKSLAIRQEIGDKSGEGATLNNISQIFKARGDNDTALEYLKKSLAITQEIGNKLGEGATLNNISQIYDDRGDYDTALEYLKKSLAIRQEIGDKSGEGTTLNNMATTAHARGDYDTALEYLKKSLAIQQEIGNKSGEGTTLNNISQIYDARGDYDTALEYLKKSLAIRQEIGDRAGFCVTIFNMGHIHMQNKKQAEALQAWTTAYSIAKKINLAQELDALENLAERLNLPGGLDGWETLLNKKQ
ncbi:MAG: tetratricopeptide repeat protein [Desulfobacteraceae bacterium]|nr:tetratricopeptide repeat protein [Desulfobacteraceae bacterium]